MPTSTFFSDDRHLNDHGIALAADAVTLDRFGSLPADIGDHLETCDRCKQAVLDVAEITIATGVRIPDHHPTLDAPAPVIHRFPRLRYGIAALLLMGITGGASFYYIQNRTTPAPLLSVREPAPTVETEHGNGQGTSAPAPPEDRFTPSPNLDDLIGTSFRSSTLEIISPKNGAMVSAPVTFLWTDQTETLKLKILTNKEVTILTAIVKNGRYTTAKKFEPGLYYWKLESDDELAAIGTFTIR
ncbi:MAG: hypothetical protein HUU02_07770 [Bacteroidetes bacterium]|nr:hypothetical protein [Bacteroidota bacterium]